MFEAINQSISYTARNVFCSVTEVLDLEVNIR